MEFKNQFSKLTFNNRSSWPPFFVPVLSVSSGVSAILNRSSIFALCQNRFQQRMSPERFQMPYGGPCEFQHSREDRPVQAESRRNAPACGSGNSAKGDRCRLKSAPAPGLMGASRPPPAEVMMSDSGGPHFLISVRCPVCGAALQFHSSAAGQPRQCPKCKTRFRVSAAHRGTVARGSPEQTEFPPDDARTEE